MVWREVLVQGPLFYIIDSELFWEMRSQFIEKAFGEKLASYRRKVIVEFQKIKKFKGKEIVLWFEYDLFCQINMIAMLSYLLRNKKHVIVSLICVGDYPGYQKKIALGQLPSTEYPSLYNNRTLLTREDLIKADKAWMLFCGKDLKNLLKIKSKKFEYLEEALSLLKQLFPKGNTLSALELVILNEINNNNFTKNKLIGHLLSIDNGFGFGDSQYEYMLHELDEFIEVKENLLSLNEKGQDKIKEAKIN